MFEIMDGFTVVDNLLLEDSSEDVTFCVKITGATMITVNVVVFIEISLGK